MKLSSLNVNAFLIRYTRTLQNSVTRIQNFLNQFNLRFVHKLSEFKKEEEKFLLLRDLYNIGTIHNVASRKCYLIYPPAWVGNVYFKLN